MSNMIRDPEDVTSISPITCFSLPDLILYARHIRVCFELLRAWFLSLQIYTKLFKERENEYVICVEWVTVSQISPRKEKKKKRKLMDSMNE